MASSSTNATTPGPRSAASALSSRSTGMSFRYARGPSSTGRPPCRGRAKTTGRQWTPPSLISCAASTWNSIAPKTVANLSRDKLESSFVNSPRGEFNRLNHWLQARARLHGALTFRTRRNDHRSPSRCRRSSMAPRRGTTRRRFLQSTALAAAGLALPRTGFAASPDLKLKKPIKIGCQCILSGPLGGYGEFMRKGATLAMEEVNGQGGIGGSPIELNFRDEELKVDVGVKNARYFVEDWGADFLIGIDSSAVALAVGEIMPSLNKVLIVTHGATEEFNEDLVFKRHVR